MNLHPAHTVRGRIVFADAKTDYSIVRVVLRRFGAQDVQQAMPDEEGRFSFLAVPCETVRLTIEGTDGRPPRGYRLSTKHKNVDSELENTLVGRVDDDVAMTIVVEPGSTLSPSSRHKRQGVVIRMPNGGSRVMETREESFENVPLSGLDDETVRQLPAN